ncbi:MAG TPA: serine hydrolase domain-containing protein [Candidatus Acidoferrum sp.]|nr:serine hydrolase domain-containing protein [Candidatus Acidoferrum sp.]
MLPRLVPSAALCVAVVAVLELRRSMPEPVSMLREDSLANPPAVAPTDAARSIEELRARIAAVLERQGVPGAGIALVDRERVIWAGGVGVASLQSRVPVDGDTVFRVASITKSIVALGAMRLAEQGKLDLDRPLAEIVPDAAIDNRWEDVAPVTLAHVLEHTAGFDDLRFNEWAAADEAQSPADSLAINPRSRVVRWRPGSRMAYSNAGYTVAARAIEVASGEPFDTWLRREVLAPLGMAAADFRRTPALERRLATGHVERGRPIRFSPMAHRPAGALLASARDLAQLVRFWLRRGDGFPAIVSPAGLARIERTATLPFPATDVGYGLGNYGDVSHPVRGRGHDGGLPGFVSSMRYFPELGAGYVVLLNATHSPEAFFAVRDIVFAYLVAGRVLPPLPEIPADPPASLQADFFAFASPRHALFAFLDEALVGWHLEPVPGGLRLDPLVGDAIDLVPTPDGGFRHPRESGTSVQLTRAVEGTPVLVAHGAYAEAASWWLARARLFLLAAAMILLQIAPLYAIGWLALAARRRPGGGAAVVWPAIAGLALAILPRLLLEASVRDVLGVVHPLTLAICATTILFAGASIGGVVTAARWATSATRPSWWLRLVPTLATVAAFGLAMWFDEHGIIGLRTWAW